MIRFGLPALPAGRAGIARFKEDAYASFTYDSSDSPRHRRTEQFGISGADRTDIFRHMDFPHRRAGRVYQLPALLTMVSGFMIQAAINNLGIFALVTTDAETIFQNILLFIGTWTRRVGAAGTLVGAVMFGFSVKDNNAVGKVAALKTFAAGAIVVSVSGILHTFV